MQAAVQTVLAEAGGVGALVNNAGYSQSGPVEMVGMGRVRRQFETNVFGLIRLTQLVLPDMRARRQGRIVNIGLDGRPPHVSRGRHLPRDQARGRGIVGRAALRGRRVRHPGGPGAARPDPDVVHAGGDGEPRGAGRGAGRALRSVHRRSGAHHAGIVRERAHLLPRRHARRRGQGRRAGPHGSCAAGSLQGYGLGVPADVPAGVTARSPVGLVPRRGPIRARARATETPAGSTSDPRGVLLGAWSGRFA